MTQAAILMIYIFTETSTSMTRITRSTLIKRTICKYDPYMLVLYYYVLFCLLFASEKRKREKREKCSYFLKIYCDNRMRKLTDNFLNFFSITRATIPDFLGLSERGKSGLQHGVSDFGFWPLIVTHKRETNFSLIQLRSSYFSLI